MQIPGLSTLQRPLRPGQAISQLGALSPGSIGCFVRDRVTQRIMLLTNHHVLRVFDPRICFAEDTTSFRDVVIQPSLFDISWDGPYDDGGRRAAIRQFAVARFERSAPELDAAVAYLNDGVLWTNEVHVGNGYREIVGAGAVASGGAVWKVGATNGYVVGRAVGPDTSIVDIKYPLCRDHHFVRTKDVQEFDTRTTKLDCSKFLRFALDGDSMINEGTTSFQSGGDSGSVVCNDRDEVVGLMHTEREGRYGLASPIQRVFDALGVDFAPGSWRRPTARGIGLRSEPTDPAWSQPLR